MLEGEILPWTNLFDIDPACTLAVVVHYQDQHDAVQPLTVYYNSVQITADRIQASASFCFQFKIGQSIFYTPKFNLELIANPCSTPPTFGARALYIPVDIAWVDIDGGAVVAPDSEFTPVTFDFYTLGAITNPALPANTNCNYQVFIDVI